MAWRVNSLSILDVCGFQIYLWSSLVTWGQWRKMMSWFLEKSKIMEKDKRKKKDTKVYLPFPRIRNYWRFIFCIFFSAAAIRLKKLLPILLYPLEDKKLNYSKVSFWSKKFSFDCDRVIELHWECLPLRMLLKASMRLVIQSSWNYFSHGQTLTKRTQPVLNFQL